MEEEIILFPTLTGNIEFEIACLCHIDDKDTFLTSFPYVELLLRDIRTAYASECIRDIYVTILNTVEISDQILTEKLASFPSIYVNRCSGDCLNDGALLDQLLQYDFVLDLSLHDLHHFDWMSLDRTNDSLGCFTSREGKTTLLRSTILTGRSNNTLPFSGRTSYWHTLCLTNNKTIADLPRLNAMSEYKIDLIPIVFPQFHAIPENDQFWGPGFTEWTLLQTMPDDIGGLPIKRPHPDIGCYNLLEHTTRKRMAQSRQYGIGGFCYYHYWFGQQKVMYKPLELMLLDGEPNLPFFFSWANETWTRRWDGGNNEVLLKQSYDNESDNIIHFNYLVQFFFHPNYIKIEGKPVFAFYRIDIEDQPALLSVMTLWEKLAIRRGFPGIFFLKTMNGFASSNSSSTTGISGVIEFNPSYVLQLHYSECIENVATNSIFPSHVYDESLYLAANPDVKEQVRRRKLPSGLVHYNTLGAGERHHRTQKIKFYDSPKVVSQIRALPRIAPVQFRGTFVGWNNYPRRSATGNNYSAYPQIYKYMTPSLFEHSLITLIEKVIQDPNRDAHNNILSNMIILNAWNEWNEQAVLEPSVTDGYAYLEAISRVTRYFS